jgi:SAM-dependent methyltransferase
MIERLERRARKAGLDKQIQTRLCSQQSLGLDDLKEAVDFALVFAVVHEVPSVEKLFGELHEALKPSGKLLVAEPKGHVNEERFTSEIAAARGCGFVVIETLSIRRCHAALLSKGA